MILASLIPFGGKVIYLIFLLKSIPKIIIACWLFSTNMLSYPSFLTFLYRTRNPES